MTNMEFYRSEHKDKPTITVKEQHFLKFIKNGWIVRDLNGYVRWFEKRPKKQGEIWNNFYSSVDIERPFKNMFSFIEWEDEEPWSVEELLKLEMKNED